MSSVTIEPHAPPHAADPVPPQRPLTAERFHQLDGLRAVAAGIVVFHHSFSRPVQMALESTGDPALTYLGKLLMATTGSGVELFFVLSGVVLLRPYVRGLRPFKPGTYFLRRAERLWPPYLVVLALEGLLTFVAATYPTALSRADRGLDFTFKDLALQVPIVNFGSPFWNMAWWSLSIEVLFYLTVPLVLPVFIWRGLNRTMFLLLAVGLWMAGFYLRPHVTPHSAVPWTYSIQQLAEYSICFLIGIAIAKFDWPPRAGWALIGLGILYVLVSVPYPALNYHAAYGMFYGGVIMLSFVRGSRLRKFLAHDLLVWLGERSYSLFLIHFTVFFAVNWMVSRFVLRKDWVYGVVSRGLGLPLALFAAMLLFHFVERRFARNLVTANQFWPPLGRRHPRPTAA